MLVVEAVQLVLLVGVGVRCSAGRRATGRGRPSRSLLLLGTCASPRSGLLLAGALRAEATLAAANLVYLLLLLGGGVVVPVDGSRAGCARCSGCSRPAPSATACATSCTVARASARAGPALVLLVWGVAATALAARTFRWE